MNYKIYKLNFKSKINKLNFKSKINQLDLLIQKKKMSLLIFMNKNKRKSILINKIITQNFLIKNKINKMIIIIKIILKIV